MMIEHVKAGGKWNEAALASYCEGQGLSCYAKISLSRFEDGKIYIHDGHHRIYSTLFAGRKTLEEDEFLIRDWKYKDYNSVNHATGFYTPFNPRREVRKPDLALYRKFIGNQVVQGVPPHEIERLAWRAYQGLCAKVMRYWELRQFTEVNKMIPFAV